MSYIILTETAAPATPGANKVAMYVGTDGKYYYKDDAGVVRPIMPPEDAGIAVIVGAGAAVIGTGVKGYLEVPFACEIQQVTLLGKESGSIVIDIWKDTYANFPPTVADSICAAAKPTLSAQQKYQDATLTGWTKTLAKGDILGINVDSAATITQVTISLQVRRTL